MQVRANVCGHGVVSVAARDIAEGEEVFENYGVSWRNKPLHERRDGEGGGGGDADGPTVIQY